MELIKNPDETATPEANPMPRVNDVIAPAPVAATESNQPAGEQKPEPKNDNNVAPAPQNTDSDRPDVPEHKEADMPKPVKPPKAPKKHGSGGAVIAAVVIIVALGAMFTYAYLRSNNIAVF